MGPFPNLSKRSGVARREGEAGRGDPFGPRVQGHARVVGAEARRRARADDAAVEGVLPHLRLREHDVRRGHARQHVSGHAAGDGAARRDLRRRDVVHRAGDSQDRSRDDRQVRGRRTEAACLQVLSGRHPAPAGAHADRRRRAAARGLHRGLQRAVRHLRNPVECGLPVSERDARRREERQARQLRLRPLPRRPEPRRSREGHERLLRVARRVPRHVRLDA